MSAFRHLVDYLRAPDPRPVALVDEEIREELEFHLAMQAEANQQAGLSPVEARAKALDRFGSPEKIAKQCRQVRIGDRIVLQRLHAALTAALVVAVVWLGYALYRRQQANETAMEQLRAKLATIESQPQEADLLRAQRAVEAGPPVVLQTAPPTGARDVDPSLSELRVTYSKPMLDESWSWSQVSDVSFPETTGDARYLADHRTCVLPVALEPGTTYTIWLNSEKYRNFKDAEGRSALPFCLTFSTRE